MPPNDGFLSRFLLIGLAALVWFAALARGAQDLWAISILCGWLSILTGTFLYAACKSHRSIALPLAWPLAALFFGVLISSRYSFDINTTRLEIVVLACGGLAFFLFSNLFQDPAARRAIIPYAGFVNFPLAAGAVMQLIKDLPTMGGKLRLLESVLPSHWSASSTFPNSAVLAGFSLSWIILAWHRRKEGRYYQCLFAACALNLLLSRSWWAAISLAVGFMFYFRDRHKHLYLQILPILYAGTSAALFFLAIFVKFGPWRDPSYIADSRLGWWTAGIRMFLEHPFVGVGLGAYGTAFPFYKPMVTQNTLFAHSFPVQVIAELGLLGAAGVLLLAGSAWRRLSAQNPVTREFQAYRATFLMLLIFSLTSIFLDYFVSKLMLLMVVALTLSSSPFERFFISARAERWAIAALILLIPSWYLPLNSSQYDVVGLNHEIAGESTQAEISFQKALALNPYEDDSCRGLARLYQRRFERSHSTLDGSAAVMWSRNALALKRTRISYREKSE